MIPASKLDLVIVGGGLAGCALALEAVGRQYSVALCDVPLMAPRPHLGEMADIPEFGSSVSESFVRWSTPGIGVARSEAPPQIDKMAFNRELLSRAIAL